MTEADPIRRLARQIRELLPAPERMRAPEAFQDDVQALLRAALARMDLVTREDFDAQTAVLRRTREKVERLEREVIELERRLAEDARANEPRNGRA